MKCRPGCAACCIAPQISTPIPNMPQGKPAGIHCANLDEDLNCTIWNSADYPPLCRTFRADYEHCGDTREQALQILARMEQETDPDI